MASGWSRESNGQVIGQPEAGGRGGLTRDEAIELARQVAKAEGWPWQEPIVASRSRAFVLFGPIRWHIMSNADSRGQNVNVQIDDATRRAIGKGFAPR
jgi:hypothetical protein